MADSSLEILVMLGAGNRAVSASIPVPRKLGDRRDSLERGQRRQKWGRLCLCPGMYYYFTRCSTSINSLGK